MSSSFLVLKAIIGRHALVTASRGLVKNVRKVKCKK
jgi:hypothetical protein